MRHLENHSDRAPGKRALANSAMVPPMALPIQAVLDTLSMTPRSIVVEFGTESARFTLPIARYLATKKGTGIVLACDFSAAAVNRIRQKAKDAHLGRFVLPQRLDAIAPHAVLVENETVDAVIAINAAPFQLTPVLFMEECQRILKPGGTLFLGKWNGGSGALAGDVQPFDIPQENAWRLLKRFGCDICSSRDVPGFEWAVTVNKPVVQLPL